MTPKRRDYYTELGIQPDASQDDIRAAYRKLAKKYHPDLHHGDTKAKERFQKIGEAYSVLSDPKKRMEYHSSHGIKMSQKAAAQAAKPRDVQQEGESFKVILKRAFQSGFGIFNRESAGGGGGAPRPQRGKNQHTQLELNPLQLAQGGKFLLTLTRQVVCASCSGAGVRPGGRGAECDRCLGLGEIPASKGGKTIFVTCPQCEGAGYSQFVRCDTCNGDGRTKKRVSIRVTIPAGSKPDQDIRLKGQGHEGAFGGENGDLIVRLKESKDSGYARDGDNLQITLDVNLLEALGGSVVEVPTPDGVRKVKLNPAVIQGKALKLTGQGLKKADGTRGDIMLRVRTQFPDRLDAEAAELLAKLVELPGWKVKW